jgi:hypothetical protein
LIAKDLEGVSEGVDQIQSQIIEQMRDDGLDEGRQRINEVAARVRNAENHLNDGEDKPSVFLRRS